MTGHGLLVDPSHLEVSPPDEPPRLLAWHGPGRRPRVELADLDVDGAVAAVAVGTPPRPAGAARARLAQRRGVVSGGSATSTSHRSKRSVRGRPAVCSARSTNAPVVTVPCWWSLAHRRRRAKNRSSPSSSRSDVERERTALVDAVVEHVDRSGITEDEILRERRQPGVVLPRELVGRRAPRVLRPDPLRVAGEPLVEPDVLPLRDGEAVAEPLVRQLVGDESLAGAVEVVGAEDRQPLGLERDLERRRPR